MSIEPKTRPPSGRANNIYIVSRLHNALPPKWESMLKELAEKEKVLALAYAPLRRAIIAEMRVPGRGNRLLSKALAQRKETPSNKTIASKSHSAFNRFVESVLPKIERLEDEYLSRRSKPAPFFVGDYAVTGAFHAKVMQKSGHSAFLYLHPSTWKSEEEEAFIELLAMLGEQTHGCSRPQVWFVDLQKSVVRHPEATFKRRQRDLEATIKHLNHFLS